MVEGFGLLLSAAGAGLVSNYRGEAQVKKAACPRTDQAGGKTTQWNPMYNQTRLQTGGTGGEQDWDLTVLPGSVLPLLWCDLCLFMYHYFGH